MERNSVVKVKALLFFTHGGMESGADDARSDAVDSDIVVGKFAREGSGELGQSALGDLVSHVGDDPANSGGRRNENYRAFFLLLHRGNDRAAKMENRVDMDIEGAGPCFRSKIEQSPIHGSTRGMNERDDGTEGRFGFGDATRNIGGLAAIGLYDFTAAAKREDGLVGRFGILIDMAANDGHVHAFPSESDGGGRADSTSSTCDQSDFSREIHCHQH